MRSRMMTSAAFDAEQILGAIYLNQQWIVELGEDIQLIF